ncbi:hypothetical protein BGZ59_004771 [Podila verticillata]|nr:hypothetical protein BGZ59_004771 [Podila verticillata]
MSEKHLLDQPGWPMAHTRNDDAADEVNQHSQVADEPQQHPRPHSSQVRTLRKKTTTRQSPNGAQAIEHEDMPVSDKPSSSLTRLEVRGRFSPTQVNSVIANPHTPSGSSSPVLEDSQNSRPESATSTPLSSWSSHANSPAKAHDDSDDASDSGMHPIDLSYLRSGSSTPVPSTQPSKVPLSIDSGEGPSTVAAQTRHVEKEPKSQDDSNEANPIVVLDDDHFEISDDDEDDDKVEIIDITAPARQSHYPPMDAMPRVPGSSFQEGFRLPSLRRLVSSMEPDSSSQRSQPQRSSSIMSVRLVVQDDDDDITGGYEDRYGRDNVRIDSEVQEIQFDRYHPWAQGPVQFIVPTEQHTLEDTPEQRRLEQYEQELGRRQIEQAYDMDDNLPHVDYDDADESSNDEERHNGSQDQGLTDDEERVSEQQVEEHAQYILNLQASLGRSQLMSPPARRGIRLAGTAPSRERLLSPDQQMLSPDRRFRERMLSPARRSGMLPDSRDRAAQPRGRQPSVEPIRLTSPSSRSLTPRSRAGSNVSTRPEFEEIFAVPDRSSLGPSRRPSVSREPSILVQRTPRSHDVRYTPNRRPSRMLSQERPYLREGLTESAAIEVPDSPRPSPSPPIFPRSAVDEILGNRDSTMRSPSPTRAGSIVRRARRDVQRTVIDLDGSPGPSPRPSPSPTTAPTVPLPSTSLTTGDSPTPLLMRASFSTPPEPLSLSETRSNFVTEILPTDHGTRSSMVQRTGSRISQETRFSPNRRSRSRQPSQDTTARGLASLPGLSERSEQDVKKDDNGLWAGARLVCSVCMDTVTDAMSTPCGHLYCRDCIETSLEYDRRCPQCRAPLTRGKLQSLAFYLNKTTTTLTTTTATTTATTTPAVASAVAAKT